MSDNENKCGECTLCCVLYPIVELKKPANVVCSNLCDIGCNIYSKRPKECSGYDCAWLQENDAPLELRPDKCGIMFTKLDERIMFGLLDPKNTPTEMGKAQIHAFVEQGFSVVMSSFDEPDYGFFIAENHNKLDVKTEFEKYLKLYNK